MALPLIPLIAGGAALAGGVMSLFGHRQKPQINKVPRFEDWQTPFFKQQAQEGAQNAQWGPIEARAREQFETQGIPSLVERFRSMPGAGGAHSSGFAGQLGLARSDLESQLAALRSQFGLQQLQTGLTPQFESAFTPGGPGGVQMFGQGLMQGGLSALPGAMQYQGLESLFKEMGKRTDQDNKTGIKGVDQATDPTELIKLWMRLQQLKGGL